jgi:hypothetical protein
MLWKKSGRVQSLNFPGGTAKDHEELQSEQLVSQQGTSCIYDRSSVSAVDVGSGGAEVTGYANRKLVISWSF